MGCTVSKSAVEPCTVTIKISGCSNLPRSYSSPFQVVDGEHLARNPKTESDHVVSLTSSTYGSLRLDSLPHQGEERARATSDSMGNTEDVKPLEGANRKQVETINTWELMEGIEDEKAALQVFRGSMGKQKMSRHDSGNQSPRVYHTLEDVDTILDIRRSLTADYRFRRGSSMDSDIEETTRIHSPMLQKRRSRALQISQEVIDELDNLRRKNLSRSQEFNFTGRRDLSQSQEINPVGRSDVSRSHEFYSRARRNLSQSQDLDSIRRIGLTRNQEQDSRKIRNLSRSQEFIRPPLAEPKEGFATRHSFETLRTGQMIDERKIGLSKPDVVLRSPMLRGLSGQERFVSSNAANIERRNNPLLQGQAQPAAEWKTTLSRAAGSTNVSLNINSPERRSGKVLEPRVASAVAALSRLGEQRSASRARSVSERNPRLGIGGAGEDQMD